MAMAAWKLAATTESGKFVETTKATIAPPRMPKFWPLIVLLALTTRRGTSTTSPSVMMSPGFALMSATYTRAKGWIGLTNPNIWAGKWG